MDPTLYDALGGREAIAAAVAGLYERLLEDPVISPVFTGIDVPRVRSHMQSFLSAVLGSGLVYAGRDLHVVHAGLQITPEMFDRTAGHLMAVLSALDVPVDTVGRVVATIAPLREDIVTGGTLV